MVLQTNSPGEANEMLSTKLTTAIAILVASAGFAVTSGLAVAPPASAYRAASCRLSYTSMHCEVVCRQDLANGGSADYPEGTSMTVNYPDGTKATFVCRNGEWHLALTPGTGLTSGMVAPPGTLQGLPPTQTNTTKTTALSSKGVS
jgi:hypothetical protein